MTRSNRFLNRLILFLVGLVALAAATLVGWPLVTGSALPVALPADDDALATGILLAALVVIVVLSVAWIATRGRGRTRLALGTRDVTIDAGAITSIVRSRLSGSPDVAGVKVTSYRVRGQRLLLIAVQTRRHPDLAVLKGDLDGAVRAIDEVLGTTLPAVAHVTTGMRTALAGTRTTH